MPISTHIVEIARKLQKAKTVSALPLPPEDISVFEHTKKLWSPLHNRVKAGENVAHEVLRIERAINEYKDSMAAGHLRPEFDWNRDLRAAERLHSSNIAWMEHDIRSRDEWRAFWHTRLRDNHEFISKLAADGIKFILIAHGAMAIAALNALVSNPQSPHRPVLLLALFGAAIGLALVAGGKIVIIEAIGTFSERTKGRLVNRKGWRSLLAINRYADRYFQKYTRWGNRLIYGSIVWFALYAFTCLLLLVHS